MFPSCSSCFVRFPVISGGMKGKKSKSSSDKAFFYLTWNTNDIVTMFCQVKLSHHRLVQNVFAAARQCIVNNRWGIDCGPLSLYFCVCETDSDFFTSNTQLHFFVLRIPLEVWNLPPSSQLMIMKHWSRTDLLTVFIQKLVISKKQKKVELRNFLEHWRGSLSAFP